MNQYVNRTRKKKRKEIQRRISRDKEKSTKGREKYEIWDATSSLN
jgi:hypothetical protein